MPAYTTEKVMLYVDAIIQLKDRFSVTLRATTDDPNLSDALTINSGVIGKGFPESKSLSGFLGSSAAGFVTEQTMPFSLKPTFEQGSLQVKAKLYTSQLSTIYSALESLIRNPSGCFEQTSSTTYPMVMALQVM